MDTPAFERVVEELPVVQYMPDGMALRQLLSEHLGKTLTPELAAAIELLASKRSVLS